MKEISTQLLLIFLVNLLIVFGFVLGRIPKSVEPQIWSSQEEAYQAGFEAGLRAQELSFEAPVTVLKDLWVLVEETDEYYKFKAHDGAERVIHKDLLPREEI